MIPLLNAFGENLMSDADGERLRALIHDDLLAGRDVVLDFSGVRIVTSSFLNAAIGRLYEDVPEEAMRSHLSVPNLSDVGKAALRSVVENAKRYFGERRYRDALDSATTELLGS